MATVPIPQGATIGDPISQQQELRGMVPIPKGATFGVPIPKGATFGARIGRSQKIPDVVVSPATDKRGATPQVPPRTFLEKLTGSGEWRVPSVAGLMDAWSRAAQATGNLAEARDRLPGDLKANWQATQQGLIGMPSWQRPTWQSIKQDALSSPEARSLASSLYSAYKQLRHPSGQQQTENLARLVGYNVDEIKKREAGGDQAGVLSQMIADAPFIMAQAMAGDVARYGYGKIRNLPPPLAGKGLGKIPYTGGPPAAETGEALGGIRPPAAPPSNAFGPSRAMPGTITPEMLWQRLQSGINPLTGVQRGLMLPPGPAGAELTGAAHGAGAIPETAWASRGLGQIPVAQGLGLGDIPYRGGPPLPAGSELGQRWGSQPNIFGPSRTVPGMNLPEEIRPPAKPIPTRQGLMLPEAKVKISAKPRVSRVSLPKDIEQQRAMMRGIETGVEGTPRGDIIDLQKSLEEMLRRAKKTRPTPPE